jgi:hypothetical protein
LVIDAGILRAIAFRPRQDPAYGNGELEDNRERRHDRCEGSRTGSKMWKEGDKQDAVEQRSDDIGAKNTSWSTMRIEIGFERETCDVDRGSNAQEQQELVRKSKASACNQG